MSSVETLRRLGAELAEWLEEHLPDLNEELGDRQLPAIMDFCLVVATEDAADGWSDTYYHIISTPHAASYRKAGLLAMGQQWCLRAPDEDD